MIDIKDVKECNGCNACVDVCPTNAITMKTNIEGFWYPKVDLDLCIDCSLCDQVCPELEIDNLMLKLNNFKEPEVHAAIHKNIEVRFDSTSGGGFSALADTVYKEGGYVGGAMFNDDFSVSHFISNDKKDLAKLRSSKYLQSDLTGFYKAVRKLLRAGEKVLVCGCPCQMAAMRLFLRKDYENLIISDFICRGINSPKVFRKYLDSLEEEQGSKVVYSKSKSKEIGWRKLAQKIIFENGKTIFETKFNSLFTRGYLQTNAYCRPSCYECKYKGFPRIADITLADFWGIENVDKTLDNDLGTSLLILNSEQGKSFFNKAKLKMKSRQVEFSSIFAGNIALTKSLPAPSVDRDEFFKDLDKETFFEVAAKYFPFKDSFKSKVKKYLMFIKEILTISRISPLAMIKILRYNFFSKKKVTRNNRLSLFVPTSTSIIELKKGAKLELSGLFGFGKRKFKSSKLENRLLVGSGAKIKVEDDFVFAYGADVEVFENAELILKGGGGTNINTTIICAEKIELGFGVQIGRNVTIRDNNGGHFISRQGYKNSRPIIIGDKVWLGEGCTIMPGVKIGNGAIVAANSHVIKNVPANSIVAGNPAEVVDKDVLWKY